MGYKIDSSLCQEITFTASASAISARGINGKSSVLYSTKDCYISVGKNPVATASGTGNAFVPAQTFFPLDVEDPNDLISVIGSSESGTLQIMPMKG